MNRSSKNRDEISPSAQSSSDLVQRRALAFSNTSACMALLDRDGQWIDVNAAFCELVGYSRELLLAQKYHSLTLPEDISLSESYERKLFAGEIRHCSFDKRYRHADGHTIWVRIDAALSQPGDADQPDLGVASFVIVKVRDVTQSRRMREALSESEARLQAVVRAMAEGVVVYSLAGDILMHNEAATEILGMSAEQLRQADPEQPEWRTVRVDGSEFPASEHPARQTLETGQGHSNVIMGVHRPDGNLRWLEISTETVRREASGKIFAVVSTFSDVTDRLRAEHELRESREQVTLALAGADLAMWHLELATDELRFSDSAPRMLGYALDEVPPNWSAVVELLHPRDRDQVTRAMLDHLDGTALTFESMFRMRRKSGGYIWLLARGRVTRRTRDDRPLRVSGTMMDVSHWKELEQKLVLLATTDELTGLLNRRSGVENLQAAIENSHQSGAPLSMVLMDIDHFKQINDTHGHDVGDEVLRVTGRILLEQKRRLDQVIRWGGEELAVLLPDTDSAGARAQAERLYANIERVADQVDQLDHLTASFGVVTLKKGESARELMRRADALMYQAKAEGRARIVSE